MLIRSILIAVFGLSATPCLAGKVDFTQILKVDNQTITDPFKCPPDKDGKEPCATPLTLGDICYYGLRRMQQNQTWAEALKRDELAKAIRDSKDFTLLDEQRKLIEDALGPLWPPSVIGVINDIIKDKP